VPALDVGLITIARVSLLTLRIEAIVGQGSCDLLGLLGLATCALVAACSDGGEELEHAQEECNGGHRLDAVRDVSGEVVRESADRVTRIWESGGEPAGAVGAADVAGAISSHAGKAAAVSEGLVDHEVDTIVLELLGRAELIELAGEGEEGDGGGKLHEHNEDHEKGIEAEEVATTELVVEANTEAADEAEDDEEDTNGNEGVETASGEGSSNNVLLLLGDAPRRQADHDETQEEVEGIHAHQPDGAEGRALPARLLQHFALKVFRSPLRTKGKKK